MMRPLRALLPVAILFVAALLVAACSNAPDGPLTVSGRVEVDDARVGSKLGGRVEQVLVREGDVVEAGALLIVLDRAELEARRAAAAAESARAQANLDLLLAGTRREDIERQRAVVAGREAELSLRREGFRAEEIEQARAQLDSARSTENLARRELERARTLFDSGTIDQARLDSLQTAFDTAQANVGAALQHYELRRTGSRPGEIALAQAQLEQERARLESLVNGARPEEIAAARAALLAAQAEEQRLAAQWIETEVRAPASASVETLDLQPGDLVAAGEPLATLLLKTPPFVRCFVPENYLGHVPTGTRVGVTVDTFPGERFEGVVRRVAQEAEFTPRNVQTTEKRAELVFETKIDIVSGGERLRPGMYADVHLTPVAP